MEKKKLVEFSHCIYYRYFSCFCLQRYCYLCLTNEIFPDICSYGWGSVSTRPTIARQNEGELFQSRFVSASPAVLPLYLLFLGLKE